jgi:hypothetical protein
VRVRERISVPEIVRKLSKTKLPHTKRNSTYAAICLSVSISFNHSPIWFQLGMLWDAKSYRSLQTSYFHGRRKIRKTITAVHQQMPRIKYMRPATGPVINLAKSMISLTTPPVTVPYHCNCVYIVFRRFLFPIPSFPFATPERTG